MKRLPLGLALFLLVSCGKEANTGRCYTEEEAELSCQVHEMAKLQITLDTAKLICAPYYTAETCYRI